MRRIAALLAAATLAAPAAAQPLGADRAAFRRLFQDLVETNTVVTKGSCTAAAAKAGAYLKAAGFADSELTYFADPAHPQDGGLVAVLPGTGKAKAILLLGHLDVVEAKREDWTRDPFRLVEEDGFFYARGVADMKGMDAIWIDTLARLRKAGTKPKRTIKLALTCGEETTWAFNGAEWLARNKPDLIAAAFALNEGGGGANDEAGRPERLNLQVGEKAVQNYRVETVNPGGHSSRPRPDNAIYQLAHALDRIEAHRFPVTFTATTRGYFAAVAKQKGGEIGQAITTLLADPKNADAERIVAADPTFNTTLRTTCVATLLEGGHANNALAQRAAANVNCRIFPTESVAATRGALVAAIADPAVKVTLVQPIRPPAKVPPLDPQVAGPAQRLAAKYWPGMAVVPSMLPGGTDAVYLGIAGIPVYGAPGLLTEADGAGIHGLNEKLRVDSLYRARDYLFDLVKAYAGAG